MPDYTLTIPAVWDAELQKEVARRNTTKMADEPTWTPGLVLREWVKQQLEPMVRTTRDEKWSRRRAAYEAANASTQQQVDTTLGVT